MGVALRTRAKNRHLILNLSKITIKVSKMMMKEMELLMINKMIMIMMMLIMMRALQALILLIILSSHWWWIISIISQAQIDITVKISLIITKGKVNQLLYSRVKAILSLTMIMNRKGMVMEEIKIKLLKKILLLIMKRN